MYTLCVSIGPKAVEQLTALESPKPHTSASSLLEADFLGCFFTAVVTSMLVTNTVVANTSTSLCGSQRETVVNKPVFLVFL